jgi:anti-anti-sigma factor
MDVRLVAQTGCSRGQAVQVKVAKFIIGSDSKCQLRPSIPNLGGVHALVEIRDGQVFARDFGAEGGTAINDRLLRTKEIEVFDGDRLQIGPMVLSFAISPKPAGEPALAAAPKGWPFENGDLKPNLKATPTAEAAQPPEPRKAAPSPSDAPAPARKAVAQRPMPTGERVERCVSLTHEMAGDLMVITLVAPNLTEEDSIAPLRADLRELLDNPWPRREVIDLDVVTYVSSRAVGVLLAHYQGLLREGGTMRLCRVNPRVQPVLEQMRVHMLIDIFPTIHEAVQTAWD